MIVIMDLIKDYRMSPAKKKYVNELLLSEKILRKLGHAVT